MSAENNAEVPARSAEDHTSYLRKIRCATAGTNVLLTKIMLPEHVAACMEGRPLDRGVKAIKCDKDLIDKVLNNYVIVKNIVSHLHWQDKLVCKSVGSLWNSAVKRLQQQQLEPVDYAVNLSIRIMSKGIIVRRSSEFCTEPMVVFLFCNSVALNIYAMHCTRIIPSPCYPPCDMDHSITDLIFSVTTAPKDCMFGIKANSMSYFPLPQHITIENMISKPPRGSDAFFCGLYIPKIEGVEFKTINVSCGINMQQDLIAEVTAITDKYTVKGVIACLTDYYLLYVDEQNAECLGFLHTMQPNIPFAYAGCLVEDTLNKVGDMISIVDNMNKGREFVSGNVMSLGFFVIPKVDETLESDLSPSGPKQNFEAYSFILDSEEWTKVKIQQSIQEFSTHVPRFEHSVAIKFSCMGRNRKHEIEQNYFRECFPDTRIAGAFGNGELGVNHPKRPQRSPTMSKRAKEDLPYEKVHAYCTIFFYIGWGKITREAERVY